MNIDEIIHRKEQLDIDLRLALSTMEKKSTIKEIRKKIEVNQIKCPHVSSTYNWAIIDDKCPYCGKQLN